MAGHGTAGQANLHTLVTVLEKEVVRKLLVPARRCSPGGTRRICSMDEILREQIALFRHGVISELVSRPLALREKEKLLAAIAAKSWTLRGSQRTQIGRTTVRD